MHARWLRNENPFYLLSAALVLLGLHRLSAGAGHALERWVLHGVLLGYTALVALAAVLIVRVARVWADARSVLLVFVLLVVASTIGADPLVEDSPVRGAVVLGMGFAFSVLLSEGVVRGCGIRLSVHYRAPYYALLALFHGHPILLSHLLAASHERGLGALSVGISSFPWLGAASLLALVPAVRRGRRSAEGNGTPWEWPLFPWIAFAGLAAALAVRTILFEAYLPGPASSHPIPLALVGPILVAAGVLLVELGSRDDRPGLATVGRWLPLAAAALGLATIRPSDLQRRFLDQVAAEFVHPFFATTMAALAFYAWRTIARDPKAWLGLAAAVLILAVQSPASTTLQAPGPIPLSIFTAVATWAAMRSRRSIEATVALAAATSFLIRTVVDADLPAGIENLFLHLPLASGLAIGGFYRDEFARGVRDLSAIALGALFLWSWAVRPPAPFDDPALLRVAYLAGLLAAGLVYAGWARSATTAAVAFAQATILSLHAGLLGYRRVASLLDRPGMGILIAGLASFAIAAIVTAVKATRDRRPCASRTPPAAGS